MSAKALETEITGNLTVVFGSDDDAVVLTVPAKWKRFKFIRALQSGDIIAALEAAFGAEQVAKLDDLDLDESDFVASIEKLAEVLGGTTAGN